MRGKRGFPLLQRLHGAQAIASAGTVRSYRGAAIGVDTEKLAYFGLSVVWRAGAHEWNNSYSDKPTYSIDLGPFLEPMRRYLLGTASFPSNITVNVQVASDTRSQCSAYSPSWATGARCPVVGFLACGIHFAVAMGNPLPPEYLQTRCYNSPDKMPPSRPAASERLRFSFRFMSESPFTETVLAHRYVRCSSSSNGWSRHRLVIDDPLNAGRPVQKSFSTGL
jgi:hypothetical protein